MCKYENGRLSIDGLNIINVGDRPEARLNAGDFGPRTTTWIRQITIHSVYGKIPVIKPGRGPGGLARVVSRNWNKDPQHSGAHIVIDTNGDVWMMCDLKKYQAWHATTVNPHSIGIEMCQNADGTIYQIVFDVLMKLVMALCDIFGIPFQTTSRVYKSGTIVPRLKDGGKYVVGVFGHRDNAWTFPWMVDDPAWRAKFPNGAASRGEGDPGNHVYDLMRLKGALWFNYDALDDLRFWKPVQKRLNEKYSLRLDEDGICGPQLVAALRKYNLWNHGVFLEAPII